MTDKKIKPGIAGIFACLALGWSFFGFPTTSFSQETSNLEELRAKIKENPDSLEIHEKYINNVGIDNPILSQQYEKWMKEYPNSAVVPYAIGAELVSSDPKRAKSYLLEAVQRDPSFVKGWARLALHSNFMGDFEASVKYNKKAYEADTSNADRFFYYVSSLSNQDPKKYKNLSFEVAKRFPNDERGAQALYWLAYRADNTEEKINIYQQLRTDFPPSEFSWSASGMVPFFNIYLVKQPNKALQIAQKIVDNKPESKEWSIRKQMATNLINAKNLISDGNPDKAINIIDSTNTGRYNPGADEVFVRLEAESMHAAGKTASAYDSLLSFYSENPSDNIRSDLKRYGTKINKTDLEISKDIKQQFDTIAEPATNFKRKRYGEKGYASLSDYEGKVLLVTYWYPGCGPCRREFPHFENVLSKFTDDQVAYVGFNIVPEEDKYVLPFVRNSGYSFTPLYDDPDNRGNLTARGAPTNYLIDPKGRIVFSHFMIGANNERMLELMIEELLVKKTNTNE